MSLVDYYNMTQFYFDDNISLFNQEQTTTTTTTMSLSLFIWILTSFSSTFLFSVFKSKTLTCILTITLTLFLIICHVMRRKEKHEVDQMKRLPLPPGNTGFPFIGEMIQFIFQSPTGEFFKQREIKFGSIFKTHILFKRTIFVSGPEAVRKVLLGEHSLVESCWPTSMRRLLGEGALATSHGSNHRLRRLALLAALRKDRVASCVSLLQEVVEKELVKWISSSTSGGSPVDVYSSSKRMTIQAAAQILLGIEGPDLLKINADILDYADGFFAIPIPIPGTVYYRALRAKQRLHKILKRMFLEKQKILCGTIPPPSCDIISQMLMHGQLDCTSFDHLIDQALELLFGGQETLSATITCLVMLLAKNPRVIREMSRELLENDVLSRSSSLNSILLTKLTYIDSVIKEVLRLYPPIGGGYRKVVKDFEIEGYRVPENWSITYSIKSTHDVSPYFAEDKDDFKPERWLALSDDIGRLRYHFIPFGAGARSCIGKEYGLLFLRVFSVILIRFIESCSLLDENPVMLTVPIIRPKNGLLVNFVPRINKPTSSFI